MFKKILIPLLIICLVFLVCPLSAFADYSSSDVVNLYSGSFSANFSVSQSTSSSVPSSSNFVPLSVDYPFSFGTCYNITCSDSYFYHRHCLVDIDFTLSLSSPCDVFILCNSTVTFSGLPSEPTSLSTILFSQTDLAFSYDSSSSSLVNPSVSFNDSIYGWYVLTLDSGDYSFSIRQRGINSPYLHLKFGIFVTASGVNDPLPPLKPIPEPGGFGDIIDDYLSGDSTFLEAQSSIRQTLTSQLSSGSLSDTEALLRIAYAQYQLQTLAQYSDASLYYYGNTVFLNELNGYLIEYLDGQIDLSTAIQSYGDAYKSALDQCSSSSEGTYISTLYSNEVDYLKFLYQIEQDQNSDSQYDGVISDDSQDSFEAAQESESEAMSLFDLQEFEDSISFDSWQNRIDVVEFTTLSGYLEQFLNDTNVGLFISIPLALTLVSIILGTSISGLGRHKEKGSDSS